MLTDLQRSVIFFIANESLTVQQQFHAKEDVRDRQRIVAGYAFAIYTDLVTSGLLQPFSKSMSHNRDVPPTSPEFFNNIHALQDFVGLVNGLMAQSD